MKLHEFIEQDKYCKTNNTPKGFGCDKCPAKDKKHCADALRNLCGKWIEAIYDKNYDHNSDRFWKIVQELELVYGIPPFNQLKLLNGIIEFTDKGIMN